MGVETEFGFTPFGRDGDTLDRRLFAARLVSAVRSRNTHLTGEQDTNVFLANGARLYIDCGAHPEYATPECTTPEEVVACIRAGNRILEQSARAIEATEGVELMLYRANTDHDPQVTFGCHESYLYHTRPQVMARNVVPHLVTRVVYSGAGGLDAGSAGIRFLVAPRVRFVRRQTFSTHGPDRGIFHGKDEPLGGAGMHRLHVVCGESLCCEWADHLRMGATALIVAMIDAGIEIGIDLQLEDPFAAMKRVAADVDCRTRLTLLRGRRLTAIQIQRRYLQRIREHVGAPFLPDWADRLCRRWQSTLDRLEQDAPGMSRTLDWPLKLALFRDHAERRGFTRDRIAEINRSITRVARNGAEPPRVDATELTAFQALRGELFEIDARFSQLGPRGVFNALDRSGVLEHRVVESDAIDNAMRNPPVRSRARHRGRVIRCLAREPRGSTCDWTRVVDQSRERVLDLPDPCGELRPQWRSLRRRVTADALPF